MAQRKTRIGWAKRLERENNKIAAREVTYPAWNAQLAEDHINQLVGEHKPPATAVWCGERELKERLRQFLCCLFNAVYLRDLETKIISDKIIY